jgi:Rha family phage regulatory protein
MTSLIPSPSVSLINGRPSVTSLKIAEHFGKRHDHVVRDIRRIMLEMPEELRLPNFGESSYTNEQGKEQPMFIVFRDGFMLLVMSYTGKKAMQIKLAYIEAFNTMEAELAGRTAQPALPPGDDVIDESAASARTVRRPPAAPRPRAGKALTAGKSTQELQVELLLTKVRMWIMEIKDAEKEVTEIVNRDFLRKHPDVRPDLRDPLSRMQTHLACSTNFVWTSISFMLSAVEDSVELRLKNGL